MTTATVPQTALAVQPAKTFWTPDGAPYTPVMFLAGKCYAAFVEHYKPTAADRQNPQSFRSLSKAGAR